MNDLFEIRKDRSNSFKETICDYWIILHLYCIYSIILILSNSPVKLKIQLCISILFFTP